MATSRSYAEMLVESLVPAMDIIASERIEAVNFDRTIKCRIIDTSNVKFGEYKVTDGTSTFKAYSEDQTFKKNDLVYVTVPMGDFNNQKIIIGKVLDEENEDDRFHKDPLESFLDITGNIISDEAITGIENSNLKVIEANGGLLQKRIWAIRNYCFEGYELLAISGSFFTEMGKIFKIKSGNYGLRLDIEVQATNTTQYYPIYLDVKSDFFGNPYDTTDYMQQDKLVNISQFEKITSMSLWLFQDQDFKISETEPYIPRDSDLDGDEIYVRSPSIRLGYDINKFTEDAAFLFCLNKNTYSSYLTEDRKDLLIEAYQQDHPDYLTTGKADYDAFVTQVRITASTQDALLQKLNAKNISLRFIYFPEDGKPKGVFSLEDCPDGTIIHWYRYKLAEDVEDSLAGPYWVEDLSLKNSFEWKNFIPDKNSEFEQIKVIIEYPGKELVAKNIWYHYDDFFIIKGSNNENIDVLNELNHNVSVIDRDLSEYIEINKAKAVEEAKEQLENLDRNDYLNEDGFIDWDRYEADLIRLQNAIAQELNDNQTELEAIAQLPTAGKEKVLYGIFEGGNPSNVNESDTQASTNPNNPLNTDGSYSAWLDRCIERLENQLFDYTDKTKDSAWQEAAATAIIEEYEQAITAAAQNAGITYEEFENSSAANEIRNEYKKRLKNIVFDLESEIGKRRQILDQIESELAKIHKINSNILKFTNQDDVINQYSLKLVKGLTLEVDPSGYKGIYKCYDDFGNIMNKSDASVKRVITATWTNIITGNEDDGIEEIRWKFPTQNTMIHYPTEGYEYDFYTPISITNEILFSEFKMQGLYTRSRNNDGGYVYNPVLKTPNSSYQQGVQYYQKSNAKIDRPSEPGDFFTIIREGVSFESTEPGSEEPGMSGQIFRIKDYYDQNATNNTIYCEVVRKSSKEVYTAQADLVFGPIGTNGTDYTFYLEIVGNDDPAILTIDETNPTSQVKIVPHLYDYENKDLLSADPANADLRHTYASKLIYRWYSPTSTTNYLLGTVDETGKIQHDEDGCVILKLDGNHSIEDYRYYILAAEMQDLAIPFKSSVTFTGDDNLDEITKKITLHTFLPIPVRSTSKYKEVDGAFKVAYNAQGVNPQYYKDPYKIKIRNDKPELVDLKNYNLRWEISLGPDTMFTSALGSVKNFYPVLATNDNSGYTEFKLIPPSYYLQDNGVEICINCLLDNSIIWTQPLYIYQDAYNSGLLNSWNGQLTINEENGTILSTMVGAGKKDIKNRFEGVLMGDISVADDSITTLGLYGYNEGVQSFGLMVDGTAFIGKSGRGQIRMDGNNGSIQSMSYFIGGEDSSSRGMKIDLDDGYIDMRGGAYTSLIYTSDFEDFDRSCLLSSEYNITGSKVTLGLIAALKYYKVQTQKDKTSVQQKINSRNGWYQSVYNERDNEIYIKKYDKILTDITKVIGTDGTGGAFAEKVKDPISYIEKLKYPDDPSRVKYLQDNGLDYLLNNQYFSMGYEETAEGRQARVQISVDDPYFKIISNNQVPIINIGMKEYFLQTDDFISDLQAKNKALVEYKRSHGSPNYTYPPEGEIATIEDIYRQGSSAAEDTLDDAFGQGFKITLKDEDPNIPGGIEGYNFRLIGINNGSIEDYAELKGSYFELNSSGDPFMRFHYRITDPNAENNEDSFITIYNDYLTADEKRKKRHEKDLLLIDLENYYLQSANYFDPIWTENFILQHTTEIVDATKAGHGTKLDLNQGFLIGHDFELTAVNSGSTPVTEQFAGSYLTLNSNGSPYLRVYHQNTTTSYDTGEEVTTTKGLKLLEISLNDWIIHSINWKNKQESTNSVIPGAGIEIDLNGKYARGNASKVSSLITAYGFKLDAFDVKGYQDTLTFETYDPDNPTAVEKSIYYGHRISINSMATGATTITPGSNCYKARINTRNLWDLLNLRGQFTAADNANYYKSERYTFIEDTDDQGTTYYIERIVPDDPLVIGTMFSVSWDGRVECYYIRAAAGQIGPFKIGPHALFTNQGVIGQLNENNFTGALSADTIEARVDKSIYGIYLGIDGFSVGGSKFIIYNLPINRSSHGAFINDSSNVIDINVYGDPSYGGPNEYSGNQTIPSYAQNPDEYVLFEDQLYGTVTNEGYGLTGKFAFGRDFVTNGYYPNDASKYPEVNFKKYSYSYDLVYQTKNGTRMKPRDITMYVRGNSLLDGITHINGSTYVMGNFQVGHLKDIGDRTQNATWDSVKNYAILYANTRVYGIFQTTGKTYLGDAKNNWTSDYQSLRSLYNNDGSHNANEAKNFGCIIYRNTYITGTFHVGGQEVYFGCSNEENVLHSKTHIATGGHFETYILETYFHGDLTVSRNFIAGLDYQEAYEAGIAEANESTQSGIYSKTIIIGRTNRASYEDHQSNLTIHANTEVYGKFIVKDNLGGHIELYSTFHQDDVYKNSYITMIDGVLKLQSSGAGSIKIDETGVYLTGSMNSSLSINGDGLTISIQGDAASFYLDPTQFNVSAGDSSLSLNQESFSLIVGGNNVSLNLSYDQFKVQTGQAYLEVSNNQIAFSSGASSFVATSGGTINMNGDITMTDSNSSMDINGDLWIHGNVYANNLNATPWSGDGWNLGTLTNPGLTIGAGAGWIAGWIINEYVLESEGETIGLDPENALIWFGSAKTDYIDGAGRGNNHQGIFVSSANWVDISATRLVTLGFSKDDNVISIGATGGIGLYRDLKTDSTIYLGFSTEQGGHIVDSKYKIEGSSGDAYFNEVHVGSGSDSTRIHITSDDITGVSTINSKTAGGNYDITIKRNSTDYITLTEDGGHGWVKSKPIQYIDGGIPQFYDGSIPRPLGKLAFEDTVKKKFKLNVSGTKTLTIYTNISYADYTYDPYPSMPSLRHKIDYSGSVQSSRMVYDEDEHLICKAWMVKNADNSFTVYAGYAKLINGIWQNYGEPRGWNWSDDYNYYYPKYKSENYNVSYSGSVYTVPTVSQGTMSSHDKTFSYDINWSINNKETISEIEFGPDGQDPPVLDNDSFNTNNFLTITHA